jgi:hypothetical protein
MALSPEVIGNIKSFSGLPDEMSAGEKLLRDGMAVQKVQTPYTTAVAVQKPRSIARVTANVLEEAKLAGSSFFYRWKVKNKKTGREDTVEGPSIDLAMCMARNYGNCAIDVDDEETLTDYKFRGVFIDLESGFTCPRLFKQRKKQSIGMEDAGRAEDIVYQIGQSKAIRNAIVRAMPNWLSEQAIEAATTAELSKIKPENIAIARARAFDFFRQYGVTQERIEAKIGRPLDNWTAQDIVDLKGMATALKEGRISANELFPEPEKKAEDTKQTGKKGKEKAPTPPPAEDKISCPKLDGAMMSKANCESCDEREGCPAYD